jgi:hypothetical protein
MSRRVEKPWGHELIWAETDAYVGKILVIETGRRLSLQFHETKDDFSVSEVDRERFADAEHHLVAELEQVVRAEAKQRAWTLVGPPEISFKTNTHLKKGVFKCVASLAEGPDPDKPSPAQLQLVQHGRHGRMYDLNAAGTTTIGREETCDVVVTDPAASRKHAEIRADTGGGVETFTLVDLGSTNGTLVDGAPVTSRALDDGDQIVIGETVLEFRTT